MFGEFTAQGFAAGWRLYEQLDQARRLQSRMLDAMGWGPVETPSRIVFSASGVTLKGYSDSTEGPVLLLVPATIKRSYIWDLAPGASVVRHALEKELRPYLVQWEDPEENFGLADYAGCFLSECMNAIRTETGEERIFVAGHSLGGMFSAVFSSMHPERIKGLVLVTAPLHFDFAGECGALGPVIGSVYRAGLLDAGSGNLPGSFLSAVSFMASPGAFGKERWEDWFASLPDKDAVQSHMRVERWSFDELRLARQLVKDIVELLYRDDGFMRGTLTLDGARAAAEQVAAPLVTVVDERCPVVPPVAILPFHEAAASTDKQLLRYQGDTGVAIQHVGALVGRNAHQRLWLEIFGWIHAHA